MFYYSYFYDFDFIVSIGGAGAVFGDEYLFKAQSVGLGDALFHARHWTHLAAESQLGSHTDTRTDGDVYIAGENRAGHSQVDGRVVDTQSAGDVEEDILGPQLETAAFLQYRQQHVHATQVEAVGVTLRRAIDGGGDQRLHLDEQRARPLEGGGNGGTAERLVAMTDKELRWIGDLPQSIAAHLEDAQLGGGSEAVLQGPQNAEAIVAAALELEHRVDDMLHHLGPRQGAVLGDMSHQKYRYTALLGETLQLGGTLADLRDRACRRIDALGGDSLYGVDNEDVGFDSVDMIEDALRHRFGDNIGVVGLLDGRFAGLRRQAVGAHLDLLLTLLAADVEQALVGDGQRGLQQQRALAYARLAAQQHDGARHQAATQHPVELGTASGEAGLLAVDDLVQQLGRRRGSGGTRLGASRRCGSTHHLLVEGVPLSTLGTAAQPAGRLVAAVAAEEVGLGFGHGEKLRVMG